MTLFDLDNKLIRIKELEKISEDPNFWNDRNEAVKITSELNKIRDRSESYLEMEKSYLELEDLFFFF